MAKVELSLSLRVALVQHTVDLGASWIGAETH
jgi:hypothetical protein